MEDAQVRELLGTAIGDGRHEFGSFLVDTGRQRLIDASDCACQINGIGVVSYRCGTLKQTKRSDASRRLRPRGGYAETSAGARFLTPSTWAHCGNRTGAATVRRQGPI